MAKRIIAVDLDGTLAAYDGWVNINHIGEPIKNVVEAIKGEQAAGSAVWIFTARISDPDDAVEAKNYIEVWLSRNNIQVEGITATKHKFFTEFWDDRAIQVVKNEGIFVMHPNAVDRIGKFPAPIFIPDDSTQSSLSDVHLPIFGSKESSALDSQVGGNHYKKWKIQPIEFCFANNIPFMEANVQKYVLRHADKNGIEDLRKAQHYLQLMAEMYYHEKL